MLCIDKTAKCGLELPNVQWSDTTGDDSSNTDCKYRFNDGKIFFNHKKTNTMKSTILIPLLMLFAACNKGNNGTHKLQAQVDSLQNKLSNAYTPGTGEIMENIRLHHAKMWFAAQNQNWVLASYEESLIVSGFKRIQKFHGESDVAKAAAMINPAMDSVKSAILQKNPEFFKRSYALMTATCNNCHTVTNHPFNVIIIPVTSDFSNQSFKLK